MPDSPLASRSLGRGRSLGKRWPWWFETSSESPPKRFSWCVSRKARLLSASFATQSPLLSLPSSCSASTIWAVLEPGAAHMSSTEWPHCTSSSSGGIMDTASWRLMLPLAFSWIIHWWKALSCGDLRISGRGMLKTQA